METEKTYWFKIEGRIYARDYNEAREQVENMAIAGTNCEGAIYDIEEVKD